MSRPKRTDTLIVLVQNYRQLQCSTRPRSNRDKNTVWYRCTHAIRTWFAQNVQVQKRTTPHLSLSLSLPLSLSLSHALFCPTHTLSPLILKGSRCCLLQARSSRPLNRRPRAEPASAGPTPPTPNLPLVRIAPAAAHPTAKSDTNVRPGLRCTLKHRCNLLAHTKLDPLWEDAHKPAQSCGHTQSALPTAD